MPRAELLRILKGFVPNLNDRTMRLAVRWLRVSEKRPIAWKLEPPWGYYVCEPDERGDLRREVLKRMASEAQLLRIADGPAAERLMAALASEDVAAIQGFLW